MKKLYLAVMLLVGSVVVAPAQSDSSSRPRVVPTATATPPAIGNNPYPSTSRPDSPPVLQGGTRPTAPATDDPAKKDDDDSVIKVETNLVTMPVSVLDRDGRFISGLQQRDFKIFENGVEQKVDYFQSVEQPFTVVLLIDVSPSTQFRINEIQNAAIAFVEQLRPGDRVMVISFDQHVHVLCQPTSDRYVLRNAIRETEFGDGTSLYEAVDHAIERELRRMSGRKAVVLFTDGVDTTSRRATYEGTLRSTEEIDALFYTVRYDTSQDLFGGRNRGGGNWPGSRRGGGVTIGDILAQIMRGGTIQMGGGYPGTANAGEYAKGKQYLESLALNSGGRAFEATSMMNLEASFSGIAEELRRQYSLGYYPETIGQAGERKQIRIRVMRPDVSVRAKNFYIVGQTNRNLAGK